jgi:hypothetical protein
MFLYMKEKNTLGFFTMTNTHNSRVETQTRRKKERGKAHGNICLFFYFSSLYNHK